MRLGLSGALAAVRLLTVTVLAVGGVGAAGSVLSACSGSANDAIDATGTKLAATRDSGTGSTGTKSGSVDGGEVDASGDDDTGDASTANDAGATEAAFDASHIIPFVDAGSSVAHKTGQTLVVNGTTRTYDITIPSSCSSSKKVPLVFVFHGDDGKGSDMYGAAFPIETAAAAAGDEAIFVYPDGLDDNENGSAWNIYDDPGAYPYTKADPSGNEDVDYFDALVKTLGGLACGDTGHVFITGFKQRRLPDEPAGPLALLRGEGGGAAIGRTAGRRHAVRLSDRAVLRRQDEGGAHARHPRSERRDRRARARGASRLLLEHGQQLRGGDEQLQLVDQHAGLSAGDARHRGQSEPVRDLDGMRGR